MIDKFRISYLMVFLSFLFYLVIYDSTVFAARPDSSNPPVAEKGVIDLRNWDLERDGPVKLDGEWEFYWKELLSPDDFSDVLKEGSSLGKSGDFINVPGLWENREGYATYRLTVLLNRNNKNLGMFLPHLSSSYNIWTNGKLLDSAGLVGTSRDSSSGQWKDTAALFNTENSKIEIVLQASNFQHREGGIWYGYILGTQDYILRHKQKQTMSLNFILGSILILGVYHIILFFRKKELVHLCFALLCLSVILRLLSESARMYLFPFYGFELHVRMYYFSAVAACFFFGLYLYFLYPGRILKKFFKNIGFPILILISSLILILPVWFSSQYTYIIFGIPALLGLVWIYGLYSVFLDNKLEGTIFIAGIISMVIIGLNDTLAYMTTEVKIARVALFPYGILVFFYSQAFLLALRSADSFKKIEQITNNLIETNKAYSRFVPKEFLSHLGKEDITKIQIGDQTLLNMTLLFSNIQAFSKLSEKMSAQENFDFLNEYLENMVPPIKNNNGFIDKFIGDTIMALFPRDAEDAINAAIEMQAALQKYNKRHEKTMEMPLRVGIGIHCGSIALGTIGESERMEGTVIADAVNLASRIEGLTKDYGAAIIVSKVIMDSLADPGKYQTRFLGKVKVKGKDEIVELYEVLDGLIPNEKGLKIETKDKFHEALSYYYQNDFHNATVLLKEILKVDPGDKAAANFLHNADNYLGN